MVEQAAGMSTIITATSLFTGGTDLLNQLARPEVTHGIIKAIQVRGWG